MIYLREKTQTKKIDFSKQSNKGRILQQLKSKILKSNQSNTITANKKDTYVNENQIESASKYQISKKINQSKKDNNLSIKLPEKMIQSIIVNTQDHNNLTTSQKKQHLKIEKLFNYQIFNEYKGNLRNSRIKYQTCIKLLQKQNQKQKSLIFELQEKISKNRGLQPLQQSLKQNKKQFEKQSIEIKEIQNLQQQLKIKQENQEKILRFIDESKSVLIALSVQVLDIVKTIRKADENIINKQQIQSISKQTEKVQNILVTFDRMLNNKSTVSFNQNLALQQMNSIILCQQKTLKVLMQNEEISIKKRLYHENSLLRYEINRVSKKNQDLIRAISLLKIQNQSYIEKKMSRNTQEIGGTNINNPVTIQRDIKESNYLKQETPIAGLELTQTNSTLEKYAQELRQKQSRIVNLQIDKQYLAEQSKDLEIQLSNMKNTINILNSDYQLEKSQLESLKQEYQVSLEEIKVQNQQIDLLKNKIRQLQVKLSTKTSGVSQPQLFVEPQNKKSVLTVEDILALLNKKQLIKYHNALIQLIQHYEGKISELTSYFYKQKQLKEKHLSFCQSLFNLIQSDSHISADSLIKEIGKYEKILSEIKSHPIDILLRKVKCLSIGIDQNASELIRTQLSDYVFQLQTRLPTLTEEYFQDGSSVASSIRQSFRQQEFP